VALFRLLDNPRNALAWFRVLQLLEGVGPVRARRAAEALISGDECPEARRLLAALHAARARRRAGEQAEILRDALAPLIENRYPDGTLRLEDLDQLVAAAHHCTTGLGHFASELALDPPRSSQDLAGPPHLDEDYLVLSTIHSAKGLEWEAVHVLALYDGNLPADMACGSAESIEEERRLLYVAITRARRRLVLYVPVRFYHRPAGADDAHGYGKPSRFLTPAVQRTCETVQLGEPPQPPAADLVSRRITASVDELFG
jgi:DNA helicase-2/ATP-dependent DNA helicase PcrA